MPIIKRNNCICATLGTVWMAGMQGAGAPRIPDSHPYRATSTKFTWYCADDCLVCRVRGSPCITDSHPHRKTSTKCRIDTVISPDDGHVVARNM